MSAPLTLPAREHGVTRVFAINLAEEDAKAARAAALLGLEQLDEDVAQIIAIRDLAGIGLAGYLTEGMGLPVAQVKPDLARLSALEGYALILSRHPQPGTEITLPLGPDLTLIGTYTDAAPKPDFTPLTSDAAKGALGDPATPSPAPQMARAAWVLLGGVLLALVLLLWGIL